MNKTKTFALMLFALALISNLGFSIVFTEVLGQTYTNCYPSCGFGTGYYGYRFLAKSDGIYDVSCQYKTNETDSDRLHLLSSSKTNLANVTFTGNQSGTITYNLTAGTTYYLALTKASAQNLGYKATVSYPVVGTSVNWTGGINNGADVSAGYGLMSCVFTATDGANLTVAAGTGGIAGANITNVVVPANKSINATASAGYYFSNWSVTAGTCSAINTTNANTQVQITAVEICSVLASFGQYGNITVTAGTGGTATGTNTSFIPPANRTINATASAGYYFANWSIIAGSCTIINTTNANTQAEVLNLTACGVRANFAQYGNLTVNATTGGSATGNNSSFIPPANLTINATNNSGYYFVNWTTNCTGTIANATNPNTQIQVNTTAKCYAQANFNPSNVAPNITAISISPTNPTVTSTLYCNLTATDAEQATLNITGNFSVNGTIVAAFTYTNLPNNTATLVGNLTAGNFSSGANVSCSAIAFDGTAYSTLATSGNMTLPWVLVQQFTPTNGQAFNSTTTDINLSWSCTGKNSSDTSFLSNLTIDGILNQSSIAVANNTTYSITKTFTASSGTHTWEIRCWNATSGVSAASGNFTFVLAPSNASIIVQNTFTNGSASHSFTVLAGANATEGGTITATNISTSLGSCIYVSNTTAGSRLNVTYNCTSATPGSASVIVGFTTSTGGYNQTTASSNAYPDHNASMTAPTITPATLYATSTATCNFGAFSDLDGDTENTAARIYAWQYNGATVAGQTASTFNLQTYGANASANVSCSIFATNSTWASSNATNMSANKSISPNYAPVITVQNTFTNSTTSHAFYVLAGATDNDVGDYIASTNISASLGSCAYVSNTTIGSSLNVTYLCTSTVYGSASVIVGFTDALAGGYNQTTASSNSYPDHAPTLTAPTITPTLAHLNDTLTCNPGVFNDTDGDTENVSARAWLWTINGVASVTTQTLSAGMFAVNDNITCRENTSAINWSLTAQATSATFTNIISTFYTSYGNTSNVTGFGGAWDYSKSVMTTATGNNNAFGLVILAIVFFGFYIVGSKYTQERALVYALFGTLIISFLLVSGNFLDTMYLILVIILFLGAIFFSSRV